MLRYVASSLRYRRGRSFGVGIGILLAVVSFSVLTAATATSRVRTVGILRNNARAAYDILVRPSGSRSAIEQQRGLVQDNFQSGLFGGITMAQYRTIRALPNVQVAAPVANLGYMLLVHSIPISIRPWVGSARMQLFRLGIGYRANDGLAEVPDASQYVFVTRNRIVTANNDEYEVPAGHPHERLAVCDGFNLHRPELPKTAFAPGWRASMSCGSTRSHFVGAELTVGFPVLLSAIDPDQEDRLVGLRSATVAGRALRESDGPRCPRNGGAGADTPSVPVVATSRSFISETLHASVLRLRVPRSAGVPTVLTTAKARRLLPSLAGRAVGAVNINLAHAFDGALGDVSLYSGTESNYWSLDPVAYKAGVGGALTAQTVQNPAGVWRSQFDPQFGFDAAPIDNEDTQFHRIIEHEATNEQHGADICRLVGGFPPNLRLVGRYNPDRLRGFSSLSKVPLESYRPPTVTGANPASVAALHGKALRPDMNIGGYVAQPPALFTTLSAIRTFTASRSRHDPDAAAPISVIRVRVAGVQGLDKASRARINDVATAIHNDTGLAVDITYGSSPAPQTIDLPATTGGEPPLTVSEGWTKLGVAVVILNAINRKSAALFALILVVCGLSVANAASAAAQARRSELATLTCLGWTPRELFGVVLGELVAIGLIAGVLGSLAGWALTDLLNLSVATLALLAAVPLALLVAVAAGGLPAWRASRATPAEAIRANVATAKRASSPRRLSGMALVNLRRRPARTALAAASLILGIAALTVLLAVTFAFRGIASGNLLGNDITLHVKGVDYIAIGAVLALAATGVADMLYLNVRERASEFATLRATGWSEAWQSRLLGYEASIVGITGGVIGAGVGIITAAVLTAGGNLDRLVVITVLAALAGLVLSAVAAVIPGLALRRLPTTQLLAADE